ncbi:MAG: hypothetical protein P8Y27_04950 [Chromatiaceae bacterium]
MRIEVRRVDGSDLVEQTGAICERHYQRAVANGEELARMFIVDGIGDLLPEKPPGVS